MPAPSTRYADWKAPAEDGRTLVWPAPADLLRDTLENGARLSAATHVRIQNAPLPALRREMRTWIGHASDAPLIATGHQTELYHPGVWAKHAMINAIADKLGGGAAAHFFAVDTDAPKHLQLKWPGGGGPVTDDAHLTRAEWSGLLAQPSPAHLVRLRDDLDEAARAWDFKPETDGFFASMRRLALEDQPLSAAVVNATHELDWSLGLRHHAMLTSPMFLSGPFLALAHHLCAHAGEFAADYNLALAEYRAENDIDDPGRPMPDLKLADGACEVPLWLDGLSDGTRERATLIEVDGRWAIVRADDAFAFDPSADAPDAGAALGAWLRRHNLRLSPRALTLTMFFRLLLVDQFVHGIGGGRYDQVLDKLIARHFKLDPPRFSVGTATLFFPGAVGQTRVCMPCLAMEGHQLKHRVLGPAKRPLVDAIAAAPRRSAERATLFARLHRELKSRGNDPFVRSWERRLAAAEHTLLRQRTLFDRELFYALQSRDRLEAIIQGYRNAMA